MEEKKLISVIVPVYNVEEYLGRCVKSILGQTFNNIEVILVDDGSTDNSGKICDNYSIADKRIKVVHKENGGLSDARNRGISIANGEYIAFVDSDDWIESDMYDSLYNACESYNLDFAMTSFTEDNGCSRKSGSNDGCELYVQSGIELLKKSLSESQKYKVTSAVWTRLYRREVIEGLSFPVGMHYEDIVFSAKVFLKSKKCGYISSEKYHYTIRDDSIMGKGAKSKQFTPDLVTDMLPLSKERTFLFEENGELLLAENSRFSYFMCIVDALQKTYKKPEYLDYYKYLLSLFYEERTWLHNSQYVRNIKKTNRRVRLISLSIRFYLFVIYRISLYDNHKISRRIRKPVV